MKCEHPSCQSVSNGVVRAPLLSSQPETQAPPVPLHTIPQHMSGEEAPPIRVSCKRVSYTVRTPEGTRSRRASRPACVSCSAPVRPTSEDTFAPCCPLGGRVFGLLRDLQRTLPRNVGDNVPWHVYHVMGEGWPFLSLGAGGGTLQPAGKERTETEIAQVDIMRDPKRASLDSSKHSHGPKGWARGGISLERR